MAFDGITVSALVAEIDDNLKGGRINKIAQPENDELLLTIKQPTGQKRLLLSASASLPLIYLTESNKPSPMTAPNFCMLLRKHLVGARVAEITQPGLERLVRIELDVTDDFGQPGHRTLGLEAMGRRSNLILLDGENRVIDCMRRVDADMSASRQVLPGGL